MNVKIFKDYKEFESRKDEVINGVTHGFLNYNNLTLEQVAKILNNCNNCKVYDLSKNTIIINK